MWAQEAAKAYQASVEMQSNVQAAAPNSEVPSQAQADFTKDPSPPPHERGTKRTAEDDPLSESHKKAKIGIITFNPLVRKRYLTSLLEQKGPPLKRFVDFFVILHELWTEKFTAHRDRENSTVFVADLPHGVTDDDLKQLFKDVRMLAHFIC